VGPRSIASASRPTSATFRPGRVNESAPGLSVVDRDRCLADRHGCVAAPVVPLGGVAAVRASARECSASPGLCALCIRRRTDFEVMPISPTIAVPDHLSEILLRSIRPKQVSTQRRITSEERRVTVRDATQFGTGTGKSFGRAGTGRKSDLKPSEARPECRRSRPASDRSAAATGSVRRSAGPGPGCRRVARPARSRGEAGWRTGPNGRLDQSTSSSG
jgi:hypothetical protein